MSSEWPVVRLGDYCLKIGSGATPRGGKNVYLELGDTALIRSQNIYNEGFKDEGVVYITQAAADKLSNVEVQEKDILINITGDSVARTCLAPSEYLPARVNQHVAIIRPDPEEFDARFLRYFLVSPTQQELLLTIASAGATRNALTKGHLESLEVCKPRLKEQKAIAWQLEKLDNKIQLNNQINQTLEQMAQAIFKSWFVDFEPTRAKIIAKAQGADPATQELAAQVIICGAITLEQLAKLEQNLEITLQQAIDEKLSQGNQTPINAEQLKATAALFPNELVESELGEIPEGWKNNKIADLGKVVTGKTPPKKVVDAYADSGVPFITPSDVDDDLFVIRTNRYLTAEGTSVIKNTRVEAGAICVTCIGSQMGKTIISPNTAFTNQQINSIIVNRACFRNYLFLNLRNRRQEIYGIGSGGSTMPIINKSNFEKLEVLLPSIEVLKKFDSIVDVSMYKVLQGSRENKGLEKLRDTLLPKLLSGEIDVSALADNTEANA